MMSGRVRVALRNTCLNTIRVLEAPSTFADSTYGSALMRTVSARITRKYCGMNTTMIEPPAARTPPHRLDCPPEMTIARTIASSREGNA